MFLVVKKGNVHTQKVTKDLRTHLKNQELRMFVQNILNTKVNDQLAAPEQKEHTGEKVDVTPHFAILRRRDHHSVNTLSKNKRHNRVAGATSK